MLYAKVSTTDTGTSPGLAGRLNAEFAHADPIDDDGEKLEL